MPDKHNPPQLRRVIDSILGQLTDAEELNLLCRMDLIHEALEALVKVSEHRRRAFSHRLTRGAENTHGHWVSANNHQQEAERLEAVLRGLYP